MSNESNLDPETIKLLVRWAVRQKRNARNLYILSGVMLINTAVAAKMNETKWMFLCGMIGLFDCLMADKCRKNITKLMMRWINIKIS